MMNNKTLKGIHLGQLQSFKPILVEWQSLIENSGWWNTSNDAPWWYNERANLSLFAGALWRRGESAFEEYSVRKQITTREQKQKTKAGRGDINFSVKGEEFVAEAKQCYPVIQKTLGKSIKNTMYWLQVACRESYRQPSYGARRIGLLFVVPRIRVTRREHLVSCLNEFVGKLLRNSRNATLAWVFPSEKLFSLEREKLLLPGHCPYRQAV